MFRDAIRSNIRNRVSKGAHVAPQNVVVEVVKCSFSQEACPLASSPRVAVGSQDGKEAGS